MPIGGTPPPPQFSSPQDKGGEEKQNLPKIARKTARQEYAQPSRYTSATNPLDIEGVKDGDGKVNLACRLVNIKGENGGKEEGTAPEDHTTAPAHSACLAVNACCEYRPTLTCKTMRCKCRKAARVCVSCRCL